MRRPRARTADKDTDACWRGVCRFIHEIQKVTKVQERSPTASIWTLYYTFTPPVSPRVFTELQVISYSEQAPRTGYVSRRPRCSCHADVTADAALCRRIIVSLPIDLTGAGDEALHLLEEKGTKGRYVSVERVMELENGDTEWRMATSSTPGGSIPNFIVDSTMAKKISSVRLFVCTCACNAMLTSWSFAGRAAVHQVVPSAQVNGDGLAVIPVNFVAIYVCCAQSLARSLNAND